MLVQPGARLGPYEILAALGTGGMGEVYRARDTRLDRTVALKILRNTHSDLGPRFAREAKAIAALSHPHICTLFDIGHEQGTDFLVMECLDGETLADRQARSEDRALHDRRSARHDNGRGRPSGRPVPIGEALAIAIQIGGALDKAHRAGIVHRDLKPSNVMLTKAGAKLLDFGLAKFHAVPHDGGGTEAITQSLSGEGMLRGTLSYMAPEQLEGREADTRSDVFAFGAVLYEMVTGRRAFVGESQASVIAAILEHDPPPISTLQPLAPPALDRIVQKCLAKDPEDRWQTVRDLVGELKWMADGPRTTADAPVAPPLPRRASVVWLVATVAVLATVVISALALSRSTPEQPITRLEVTTPPTSDSTSFALSPDGRQLVFVATADGKSKLWLRPLDRTDAQALSATEGATFPFWAPDSRAVAFFADGRLKRVDLGGGGLQTLADAPDGAGGTWNRDDVILFAPAGAGSGLKRVAATGGTATAVTRLEAGAWNHLSPAFLPDGRRFVFFVRNRTDLQGVYLGSLDGPDVRRLLASDSAAAFAPPGYLLVVREGVLVAIPFDAARGTLVGEPVPVAQGVGSADYRGAFSVSATGLLAHRLGVETKRRQLVWLDRGGTVLSALWPPDESRLLFSQLAPDGQRVAVGRTVHGNSDIWLIDTARGVATRLTSEPAVEGGPVWSPDGSRIMFGSNRNGVYDIFETLASGTRAEQLVFSSSDNKAPADWSPDGHSLLFVSRDAKTGASRLSALPLDGTRQPPAVIQTNHSEDGGQFSPDGRWIAYRSDESGQGEIYVRPFPGPGRTWPVSTRGGSQARWGRDGKELFYIEADATLMVVTIGLAADQQTVTLGAPVPLFRTHLPHGGGGVDTPQYAVTPDGQRFLMNIFVDEASASPITIVQNWTAGLKK